MYVNIASYPVIIVVNDNVFLETGSGGVSARQFWMGFVLGEKNAYFKTSNLQFTSFRFTQKLIRLKCISYPRVLRSYFVEKPGLNLLKMGILRVDHVDKCVNF